MTRKINLLRSLPDRRPPFRSPMERGEVNILRNGARIEDPLGDFSEQTGAQFG